MFLPALRTKYDAEQVTTSLDSRSQNLGASHEPCRSQTSRPPSGASWAVIGAVPSHSVMRGTVTSPRGIDFTYSPRPLPKQVARNAFPVDVRFRVVLSGA